MSETFDDLDDCELDELLVEQMQDHGFRTAYAKAVARAYVERALTDGSLSPADLGFLQYRDCDGTPLNRWEGPS